MYIPTGLKLPQNLPQFFPKGPWIVNLASPLPDDEGGWRAQELTMTRQLQDWGADRLTPTNVTDQWRKGGFALKVMTRSVATRRQGTRKTM